MPTIAIAIANANPTATADIASELTEHLLSSSRPLTSGSSGSSSSSATDENAVRRAALSQAVDSLLSDEVRLASISAAAALLSDGGAPNDGGAADAAAAAQRAADEIVRSSPSYAVVRDALRQSAVDLVAGGECTEEEGGKKRRTDLHAVDNTITAGRQAMITAGADLLPAAAEGSPATTAAPPKSYSLFDMLDAQPPAGQMERVTADAILQAYGEASAASASAATAAVESGVAAANDVDFALDLGDVASLFDKASDLEDVICDPFGRGDVWPEVNTILRRGLGLRPAAEVSSERNDGTTTTFSSEGVGSTDAASNSPTSPASTAIGPDIAARFAKVHSHLDGLCGGAGRNPCEFAPQRLDLVNNVIDGIVSRHGDTSPWYRIKRATLVGEGGGAADGTKGGEKEVMVSGVMTELLQTWYGLIPGAILVLDAVPDEDADSFLEGLLGLLATSPTLIGVEGTATLAGRGVGPAHLMAAIDPYADWFAHLARMVPPTRLVRLAVQTGLLSAVMRRCHGSSNGRQDADGGGDNDDEAAVLVGTMSDLDHCLYLQSLSILRSILVATAGSEILFPYEQTCTVGGAGSHPSGEGDAAAHHVCTLAPFQTILAVGVAMGGDVVDEDLAHLCGEAVEAVLRGSPHRWQVFEAVFSDFVADVVRGMSDASGVSVVAPATVVFFRVCCALLITCPWKAATQSGWNPLAASYGAIDPFLSSINSLIAAVISVFTRVSSCTTSEDMPLSTDDPKAASELGEILLILEPILETTALLDACKKEGIASTIRHYHSMTKKTGVAPAESSRFLLRFTTTHNGVAMLEDLGLIHECMYYAAALVFANDLAYGTASAHRRNLYSQISQMLATKVGFQTFVGSRAMAQLRSYMVGIASNEFDASDLDLTSLVTSIFASPWVQAPPAENKIELEALLRDLVRLTPIAHSSSLQFFKSALEAAYINSEARLLVKDDVVLLNQIENMCGNES